jgi:hypothetical protein
MEVSSRLYRLSITPEVRPTLSGGLITNNARQGITALPCFFFGGPSFYKLFYSGRGRRASCGGMRNPVAIHPGGWPYIYGNRQPNKLIVFLTNIYLSINLMIILTANLIMITTLFE